MSVFDQVGRNAGDRDSEQGRDQRAKLNHNRVVLQERANSQIVVQRARPQQHDSELIQKRRNVQNLIECEEGDQNLSLFSNEIINARYLITLGCPGSQTQKIILMRSVVVRI